MFSLYAFIWPPDPCHRPYILSGGLEQSLLDQVRVEGGDPVDGVAADDGKVGHVDYLLPVLRDAGQGFQLDPIITGTVYLGLLFSQGLPYRSQSSGSSIWAKMPYL